MVEEVLEATGLNIATIIVVLRLELTEQDVFLSHLRGFHVCLGVVSEEEVVVCGVCLDPGSEFGVGYKSNVTLGLVMARFVSDEQLLEICVVENEGVGSPSVVGSLLVFANKADSVHSH